MDQHLFNSMETGANDILVSVSARTDVGRLRAGNEDAFLIADLTTGKTGLGPDMTTHEIGERGSLLIVSDGMGGAVAGEIASELAVKTIRESLLELPLDLSIPERLKTATEIANERVWTEAQLHPELLGMGATVTAVLAHGPMAYVAQVGDSRAYMIRGERIKQITKDQSFAQALLDSGAISLDQIHTVPQNVIMQAIGTQPTVKVVLTAVELHRNDYLIICSDGLSTKIKADEMRNAIHQSADLSTACRCMIDMANERGGEDNITVIAAQFDGVGLNSANDSSSITGSFKSISSDYLREKPAGQTQPLSSMPPPDPSVTTMVMPSLASIKEVPTDAAEAEASASAEPAADTVEATADDITAPSDTSEITLPLINEEIPVASLMSESAKTETAARASRAANIISWIIGLLVLSGAAYMIYTMLQEI